MLTKGYLSLEIGERNAYIKNTEIGKIRRIDAVVFDCDGVLIDIRNSYNLAISKTVKHLLEGLTGFRIPQNIVTDDLIYRFRRTGGFNNDWDTVYGIVMFVLSKASPGFRKQLKQEMLSLHRESNPYKRFTALKEISSVKKHPEFRNIEFVQEVFDELGDFANLLEEDGINSVDRKIMKGNVCSEDFVSFYKTAKSFIHSEPCVGISMIATMFEEFFLGSELLSKTHGVKSSFNNCLGLIENEVPIIKTSTIKYLTNVLGRSNIGIASGSWLHPAKHILGNLLDNLNPNAVVFLEEIEKSETEMASQQEGEINLKKPNPFSLLKASQAFGNCKFILYVGDSVEDLLMAQKAKEDNKHFLFAGVYQYSDNKDLIVRDFIKLKSDLIIPSVNDLKEILEKIW